MIGRRCEVGEAAKQPKDGSRCLGDRGKRES